MGLINLFADTLDAFEPQRSNNWSLEISGLPGGGENLENIVMGLQTFQLPTETTEPVEIMYLNEKRTYAGRTTYDGGSLQLVDYIDRGVANTINAWVSFVFASCYLYSIYSIFIFFVSQ